MHTMFAIKLTHDKIKKDLVKILVLKEKCFLYIARTHMSTHKWLSVFVVNSNLSSLRYVVCFFANGSMKSLN